MVDCTGNSGEKSHSGASGRGLNPSCATNYMARHKHFNLGAIYFLHWKMETGLS